MVCHNNKNSWNYFEFMKFRETAMEQLTLEQQERIEKNYKKALELRQAKNEEMEKKRKIEEDDMKYDKKKYLKKEGSEEMRYDKLQRVILSTSSQLNLGELLYNNTFIDREPADNFYDALVRKIEWKQRPVKVFGIEIMQPRKVSFASKSGKPYPYTGQVLESQEWIIEFDELATLVQNAIMPEYKGTYFNSVHMNLYENGEHHIGWHSDDEPLWGKEPVIASISFGASRKFQLKEKNSTNPTKYSYNLGHGSLIVMLGPTQTYWKHQVPKEKKVTTARINLTFRRMVDTPYF